MPFKRRALHDLFPLLVFQSLQRAQIQLFSLWLSHSHFPTHTHTSRVLRALLRCRQLVSQFVRLASETGVMHSYAHTQCGSQWEIFGMVSLGMSWHVWGMYPSSSLLSLPPLPFPSCPTGRGRGKAGKQQLRQHAWFLTLWPRLGFFFHENETVSTTHFTSVMCQVKIFSKKKSRVWFTVLMLQSASIWQLFGRNE